MDEYVEVSSNVCFLPTIGDLGLRWRCGSIHDLDE